MIKRSANCPKIGSQDTTEDIDSSMHFFHHTVLSCDEKRRRRKKKKKKEEEEEERRPQTELTNETERQTETQTKREDRLRLCSGTIGVLHQPGI
jgi:hypothetical protein